MGAFSRSNPGSGSFTVPSVVRRVWVSCIGGGGGSNAPRFFTVGPTINISLSSTRPNGGGGGGWGNGAVDVSSTSINYTVGAGGAASGWNGNTGVAGSGGGTTSCLGISGFGGGLGLINGSGGAGGGFSAPAGANGGSGTREAGGPAGGRSGRGSSAGCRDAWAGGGGNGSISNGSNGDVGSCSNAQGGDGGAGGGGGGGIYYNTEFLGRTGSFFSGTGGVGEVSVSWIDLTVSKTTLRSNEPITVTYNSPVSSGTQTVSYTNNGTSNITQTYTRTDSRGAQSSITFTILPAVRINSFSANPNPQTSGLDGIPNYNTTLSWGTTGATSASINRGVGTVGGNGSTTVTGLPQSTAGSNSPATRTYTLTASDGFNTDTETITVSVFNDNVPNNYTLPNQTNLAPNTLTTTSTSISGIDMSTTAAAGPNVQVSNNNTNWASTTLITNGQIIFARAVSPSFNTDPSGLTNSSQFYIDVGPLRRFFTLTTRAPDVNETFNYPNFDDKLPFPDIDTIPGSPDPYITTNTLTVDDVEIDVEIKTNNSNSQVRVKQAGSSTWGNWQDVRSI
jgi:hypothetical protein